MLNSLFENVKVYGRYIRNNNIDGLDSWNAIKSFIQKPEQKIGLNELNKIIGNDWSIKIKLPNGETTDLNKIYEYVHGENSTQLGIYGETDDDKLKSLEHKTWEQYHFFLQLIRIPVNSSLNLIKLLQIAYNLGQLSTCLNENNFSMKAINYFHLNNLNEIDSYIKLTDKQDLEIKTNVEITDLITNLTCFILEKINLIQMGGSTVENTNVQTNINANSIDTLLFSTRIPIKPFYSENIEKITKENEDYRRVLYTGMNQQFVLMSIPPNDSIKMEIHETHDQFIRIEQGAGKAIIDKQIYELKSNSAFIIPAGTAHKIINSSNTEALKLYTIYSPPEHPDKLIQTTNPDKLTQTTKIDSSNQLDLTNNTTFQNIIKNELELEKEKNMKSNIDDKINYKKKYIEYKNKYIALKKFI